MGGWGPWPWRALCLVLAAAPFRPVQPEAPHPVATRSTTRQFYSLTNHLRQRYAFNIRCALCPAHAPAAYARWLSGLAPGAEHYLLHTALPALFNITAPGHPAPPPPPPHFRPRCHVLWVGAGPATVYAETAHLQHVVRNCGEALFVTASEDATRDGFAARFHVTASPDALCAVPWGGVRFDLVVSVAAPRRARAIPDAGPHAAGLSCLAGLLAPGGHLLVLTPQSTLPGLTAAAARAGLAPATYGGVSGGCHADLGACAGFYSAGVPARPPVLQGEPMPVPPQIRREDLLLAYHIRCAPCNEGHTHGGRAYLNKTVKSFGSFPDRQYFEEYVPRTARQAFRALGQSKILFAAFGANSF